MVNRYSGADKRLEYLFAHATEVTLTDTLQAGDAIAKFTIDGRETIIKSPKYSTVSYTDVAEEGVVIGILTINGQDYNIYSPTVASVDYASMLTTNMSAYEEEVPVYSEPTYQIGKLLIDDNDPIPILAPPATGVTYRSNYNTGINVGTLIVRTIGHDTEHEDESIVVDKQEYNIIIPSSGGGGGAVDDVLVNGQSVVHYGIAGIDLTGYQLSIQRDLDRIYDVCVGLGQTPPSHGFADVMLTAMFAINNMKYVEVESDLNINMRYFDSAKEVE